MKRADAITTKIFTRQELSTQVRRWRLISKSIAFTNGVFDILHTGHIKVLSSAAAEADILIAGINSDSSVKRLKGPSRPVNPEADRALLIASLLMVDAVVIFEEDTPLKLIQEIKPDVLIKGGDYSESAVVGSKEVEARGGRTVIIPLKEGYSTTNLIEKLKQPH